MLFLGCFVLIISFCFAEVTWVYILINEGIDSLLEYEDRSDVTNVIKLNLACLYMLVGKYNEAENRLIELSDTLNNYSNALYATYVPSNLAALYLLKGDFAKA